VTPPRFDFFPEADLLTPLALTAKDISNPDYSLRVVARLKPGLTLGEARQGLEGIARGLAEQRDALMQRVPSVGRCASEISAVTPAIATEGFWRESEMVWGLTLLTILARGKAGFSAEELREMAGIGVAHLKGNLHNALLRLAQQSSRDIHPQIDVIT
jgi:hypothetical protein